MNPSNLAPLVNLFNEVGMLAKIERSGFAFLGSGRQSVADHSHRMALIGGVLGELCSEPVDKFKLLMICLLHDLPEARIGDLNYVQKSYVNPQVNKVIDSLQTSFFGVQFAVYISEYEEGRTLESKLAHDADVLELLLKLKEENDLGNKRALEWFSNSFKRLKTEVAKQIAEKILETPSDEWWKKII